MPVKGGGGAPIIKSTQQLQVLWNDTNTTKTVTISSVDPTKCAVLVFKENEGTPSPAKECISVSFNSGTQILLTRWSGGVLTKNFNIQIIEFDIGIKSIQRGQKVIPGAVFTEQTQAITAVNIAKSILYVTANCGAGRFYWGARIISSTSLGFITENTTFEWVLVEFY